VSKEEITQQKLVELYKKITELRKLEIIRQSAGIESIKAEDVYNNFFLESKDHVLLVQDRRITFLSPALAMLLGYAYQEIIDTPFGSYVHPDELPKLVEIYRRRTSGKDAPALYSSVVRHRDGRDIPIEIRADTIVYQGKLAVFALVTELST
jgi:PAS domain S-box-containing protein